MKKQQSANFNLIKIDYDVFLLNIKNITVLGSGIMGHGIAQVSAMAEYNVVLRDIEQQFLDKAIEKIRWSLDKFVSKQKIPQQEAQIP